MEGAADTDGLCLGQPCAARPPLSLRMFLSTGYLFPDILRQSHALHFPALCARYLIYELYVLWPIALMDMSFSQEL